MVAVRGLMRSLHSNFGFEPRNAMLVDTDLSMAGYRGDAVPAMQKRMIDAVETIPGVASVGLVDWAAVSEWGHEWRAGLYRRDYRPEAGECRCYAGDVQDIS